MHKIILFIVFTLIIFNPDFSYSQVTTGRIGKEEIKKLFTWDIQKENRGHLMFLDIPYRSGDSLEYVSLTVAKDYNNGRPFFISVIVPPLKDPGKGISLSFGKTIADSGKREIVIDKSTDMTVPIEKCNKEFCTARMHNGFMKGMDSNDTIDVFAKYMSFNHLYVSFTDANGIEKVAIPLFSFQQQYNALVAMDEKPPVKIPYSNIQLTPDEAKDDSVWDNGGVTGVLWKYAGFDHPIQFKKFLKYLKYLVKNNKKEEIAQFIDYSVLKTKRSTLNIKSENDFLNNYDMLFNDRVKTALENQKLNQIFRNMQGAMIGGGQLWFEETTDEEFKIIAINY